MWRKNNGYFHLFFWEKTYFIITCDLQSKERLPYRKKLVEKRFVLIYHLTGENKIMLQKIKKLPWIPIICFGFVFWAGKAVLDSDLAVVALGNCIKPMHERITKKLRKENKAEWWKKDGIYSEQAYRNANAREWKREFVKLCKLKVDVKNSDKIPKTGKLIVIANHDNWDAGNFLVACIDEARNNDDARVLSILDSQPNIKLKLVDLVDGNGHMSSNGSKIIKEHFDKGNALVIFPRVADWVTARQDRTKAFYRFMDGFLRFAIENESDILPAHVRLEYPLWWRLLWWVVPNDLGLMILLTFHYHIYSNTTMRITFGDVIPYHQVKKDENKFYMKRGKKRYPDSVLQKYEDAINRLMR